MKVFKFGGASVKSADAVRNLGRILKNKDENLVVVISAMGKTTNLMETLVKAYFNNQDEKWDIFNEFKKYHVDICRSLFGENIPGSVAALITELKFKLQKLPSLDFNYEYDQVVPFGELVSTRIISEFLNQTGINNLWTDVRSCLRTDDIFRDASVDWELTEMLCRQIFTFKDCNLYITQGFIGSTPSNLTTTLGREGSDYTAAIIGNVLNAESVWFWKDVPGVLSADPKLMPDAVRIKELSYREAVEMTHSGAKIIHPKTMKPLHNKKIPLYVKSFLSPEIEGTTIREIDHRIDFPPIFILKENQILVTLSPKDFSFINVHDMERVVGFLLENRIKVTLMQQSAIDLNVVLDAPEIDLGDALHRLSVFYKIRYNTDLTLITIRHYTEETLDWMVKEKDIYLEQHSRLTARMLVKQ